MIVFMGMLALGFVIVLVAFFGGTSTDSDAYIGTDLSNESNSKGFDYTDINNPTATVHAASAYDINGMFS